MRREHVCFLLGILTVHICGTSTTYVFGIDSSANPDGSTPTCNCEYVVGNNHRNQATAGCKISFAPPQGWKCACVQNQFQDEYVCSGKAIRCAPSENCPVNCVSKECCLRGTNNEIVSNCNGYKMVNARTTYNLRQSVSSEKQIAFAGTGLVAEINTGDTSNGGGIYLASHKPNVGNDLWDFTFADIEKLGPLLATQIKNRQSGKCLEFNRNSNNLNQWDCNGGNHQKWYILDQQEDKDRSYLLKNVDNGKCVYSPNTPGSRLIADLCTPWNRMHERWSSG